MKALTIWQPWASLIMIGAKPDEFRRYDYRARNRGVELERIVLHAGARPMRPNEVMGIKEWIMSGESPLHAAKAMPLIHRLLAADCQGIIPLAAGLGTVTLGTPRTVVHELPDSDRADHHLWAWPMLDPQPFQEPVPMRGLQGFWNWPIRVTA